MYLESYIRVLLEHITARTRPNGKGFHFYLPNGMLNVVRYDDFSESVMFQQPAIVSIIEKYFPLLSVMSTLLKFLL